MSDVNPKITYCVNNHPSNSSKTVATCSSVQYNKLNTGGNNPSISKRMLYAQTVRSNTYQTGFLKPNA
uniref:Uncharacterized protein n=1 Tax=viral metagenome TaxID=1070528 RepID=A0A6C0HHA0_9ZZZZ